MNNSKNHCNHIVILNNKDENILSPINNNIGQTNNITNVLVNNNALQSEIKLIHDKLFKVNNQIVIVANSFNSFVAIYYAKMYPKSVKHLILLGCPPFDEQYVKAAETLNQSLLVTELLELRKNNQLINTIKQIKCPISFLHGKLDSNPYEGVQDVLNNNDVDFEFILYDKCGAELWNELKKAPSFFKMLNILINEF